MPAARSPFAHARHARRGWPEHPVRSISCARTRLNDTRHDRHATKRVGLVETRRTVTKLVSRICTGKQRGVPASGNAVGSRSSEQKGPQVLTRKSWQDEDGGNSGSAPRRTGLRVGVGLAMLLFAATGWAATNAVAGPAGAAAASVVPPNGTVAGEGYAYYQEHAWQLDFSAPPSGPKDCMMVTVNGQEVEFIGGAGDHTCTLPGGRPIYVDGPGNECSTLKGDHNGFGTSDSQLVKCARAAMKGVVAHATIDGHPITNFGKLITATGAYPIRITKNRFPGITARTGRDAAYGYGLLVIGLTKGTHTLYHRSSFGTSTFTLHVR